MKTSILLTVLMIGMIIGTFAQKPSITLTFTAEYNGQYVPMDSIFIENITQGVDTTLYAPDTVLVLDYVTGIGDDEAMGGNVFSVSQNYPNPMEGKTTVELYLTRTEKVIITVSDIMGRELIHQEYRLDCGSHSFAFFPGSESLYFLTARIDGQSETIKMFNAPTHASISGICKLEHNGAQDSFDKYKSGNNLNNFVFNLGDQLKHTASSALGDRTIIDSPTGDQTYTFQYASGIPCPGIPTITDIDGNTYNTVLIGDQCWMKENLKTTTYQNGTAIPNVTETNAWNNLTSGAYVWYNNYISWNDSYGVLYNWFATVDPNGLCPTGWHVPTNNEWYYLTDFFGGISSPHGNELKSCRQVNSPLGGGCNTSEHPRWNEDILYGNYGTDDYDFSALPGGYRDHDGVFYGIGNGGSWWSSTGYTNSARSRLLIYGSGNVYEQNDYKQNGLSVRCLRD